jgi:hypothetical protein
VRACVISSRQKLRSSAGAGCTGQEGPPAQATSRFDSVRCNDKEGKRSWSQPIQIGFPDRVPADPASPAMVHAWLVAVILFLGRQANFNSYSCFQLGGPTHQRTIHICIQQYDNKDYLLLVSPDLTFTLPGDCTKIISISNFSFSIYQQC